MNITVRVYAHLSDDAQLDQAADAFQSIYDGSSHVGAHVGRDPAAL